MASLKHGISVETPAEFLADLGTISEEKLAAEQLRELEELCVMELVHPQSGELIARQVPEPNSRQQQLLDALGLHLPSTAPVAHVHVGTRKKIQQERKPLVK